MKAQITIERTLSEYFEVEYDSLEDLQEKAEKLLKLVRDHPEEMDDCSETWCYAATDERGYEYLIPWSR